jgi:predicted choloylglycine hydrolase
MMRFDQIILEDNMNTPETILKTTSTHVVLEGTAYEIGEAQAAVVKTSPGWAGFFESGRDFPARASLAETNALLRQFHPALEEEVAGFCDSLKISPADLSYYAHTHLQPHRCSHLVAQPELTADGHILMGRNYDFNHTMDDLRLCTTRLQGKATHIGFSSLFFGRHDGLNEYGLAVTSSVGGMPVGLLQNFTPPPADGFQFWALVRVLLEECRTVAEAELLFSEFPISGNPILLVADPSGAAIVAEAFGRVKSIRKVEEGWAVSTNHFNSPELQPYNQRLMGNSFVRAKAAGQALESARGRVTSDTIKSLLGMKYPHGLACHYYEEFFGLLHSMVFDLTEKKVEVAFGSPACNSWNTFSFDDPLPEQFETCLPMEKADPSFWAPPA